MIQEVASNVDLHRLFGIGCVHTSELVPAAADSRAPRDQPNSVAPVRQGKESGLRLGVPADTWLEYSGFSSLNQRETLNQVLLNVQRAMASVRRRGGQLPLVIFDLDDTLFQAAQPRTHRIMQEWLSDHAAAIPADVKTRLTALDKNAYGYGAVDAFENAGCRVDDPRIAAVLADFKAYWTDRFFSNDYLKYDEVQPGAVAFVQAVRKLGANIAYLTGRDEARMGKGSRAALQAAGFPNPSRHVRLILKADPALSDAEFKKQARADLTRFGRVIATFDNSPGNIVALKDNFPTAMNVFVKTLYDKGPVELRSGLYKVATFERS